MTNIDKSIIDLHRAEAERFPGGASWVVVQLGDALAAERARADQAEQRIADAPHEPTCFIYSHREVARYCNCWKSAAPTTEQ